MIAMLVFILVAAIMMSFSLNRRFADQLYHNELALDNLKSGLNIALYLDPDPVSKSSGLLGGSSVDSYYVEKRNWGLFGLITATGVHGQARITKSFLVGTQPKNIFKAALFLADNRRPLSISGKTKLQGALYLPEKGIETKIIGNTTFQGNSTHQGAIQKSAGIDPGIDFTELEQTQSITQRFLDNDYKASQYVPEKHIQTWESEPIILATKAPLILSSQDYSGQVIIMAPEIYISKEAMLDHVIVIADSITIEDGFAGNLQCIAIHKLIVGQKVRLSYPSAIVVSNPSDRGLLKVGKETVIEGIVLNDPSFLIEDPTVGNSYTLIENGSTIGGNLLIRSNLDLRGKAIGNVITNNFRLKLTGPVYDNHLLNAEVTDQGISSTYLTGFVQKTPCTYQVIEELKEGVPK